MPVMGIADIMFIMQGLRHDLYAQKIRHVNNIIYINRTYFIHNKFS